MQSLLARSDVEALMASVQDEKARDLKVASAAVEESKGGENKSGVQSTK